jgi:hypothetical protein
MDKSNSSIGVLSMGFLYAEKLGVETRLTEGLDTSNVSVLFNIHKIIRRRIAVQVANT